MQNYKTTIYVINDDNSARFVLGKYSTKPLIVFGINPSKASAEKNDTTISIVEKIAQTRNCDGYIMLNLYPLRATEITPKSNKTVNFDSCQKFDETANLELCQENIKYISEYIKEGDEIIAAWGTHILDRAYFISQLEEINDLIKSKNCKWICLSKTKNGHPHHPTRLAYERMTFEIFDMDKYLQELK